MKIKHLLLSAIAVATALVSCQKDLSKEQAYLVLSDSEIAFESSAADTKTIKLTSTRMWEVQIPADAAKWVSVSPDSGEASADPQTIEITVTANPDNDRTAEISFRIVGGTKKLTVSQKGDKGEAVPGDGSLENPYSTSEALSFISSLPDENVTSESYYIKGIVVSYKSYSTDHNNISIYISDSGTSDNQLYVYGLSDFGGAAFASEDAAKQRIPVGSNVVVYGKVQNFKSNTPEVYLGKLISVNDEEGEAATSSAEGLVVALTARAIVIKTSDGYAYAFSSNGISGVAVGDYVKAEGTAGKYAGISQIEDPEITVQSSGNVVQHPTPKIIGADNIEGFSNAFEYVRLSGTLVKSGNYYNITIPGSSKQGSLSYPATDYSSFNNSMVDVEGYFVGWTSSNTYFNIATVSVAESNASYFFVSPDSFNVPASATSVSIEINSNVAWTVSSDNPAFAVSSASGEGKASVNVTFDANTESTVQTAKITVSTTAEVTTASYEITITQAAYQEGVQSATLNFKDWGFDGASNWKSGYEAHTVEFDVATVNFGSANKQASTATISDCPVTKGAAPITVVMKSGLKITGIKINGKQWGSKTKTMSLFTSTDGGATYGDTSVANSSTFVLDAPALADGIDAVKIDFTESDNQIGIESIEVSYK